MQSFHPVLDDNGLSGTPFADQGQTLDSKLRCSVCSDFGLVVISGERLVENFRLYCVFDFCGLEPHLCLQQQFAAVAHPNRPFIVSALARPGLIHHLDYLNLQNTVHPSCTHPVCDLFCVVSISEMVEDGYLVRCNWLFGADLDVELVAAFSSHWVVVRLESTGLALSHLDGWYLDV